MQARVLMTLCLLATGTNCVVAQQNASRRLETVPEASAPTAPTNLPNASSTVAQTSPLVFEDRIKNTSGPQAAETLTADRIRYIESVCLAVAREAMANKIPAEFFARLIWQESRFNPGAQSYKGAQGIAQFMPTTARLRGVANSFEPFEAVHESARWLAELRDRFGNLGLAAAAYNAGPSRVQNWLAGRASLPLETERYVRIVTGHSAREWLHDDIKDEEKPKFKFIPCNEIAKAMARRKRIGG